ncbi:MAG: hypothetical protein M1825_001379 [Sarcosagium campestre]|nr:MAG: hypothetical protein M1825_001379 [Sarcosagium campestre]
MAPSTCSNERSLSLNHQPCDSCQLQESQCRDNSPDALADLRPSQNSTPFHPPPPYVSHAEQHLPRYEHEEAELLFAVRQAIAEAEFHSWSARPPLMDSDDDESPRLATSTLYQGARAPLINQIKNEWMSKPIFTHSTPDTSSTRRAAILKMIRAPRFRRYGMAYLALLFFCFLSYRFWLQPHLDFESSMMRAFSEDSRRTQGWYGVNLQPEFTDMVYYKTLDEYLVPISGRAARDDDKRLIFIGDVHGCKEELLQLLDKVKFKRETDHLVFVGDLIAKGNDSAGVVDLAIELRASCVRGNHEDRTILARNDMYSQKQQVSLPGPGEDSDETKDNLDEESFSHGDYSDRALAKSLSREQFAYLKACPVVLSVGRLAEMGDVVVAHGGLVPGVHVHRQDPFNVMNMRTIDLNTHVPSDTHDYTPWTKLWNHYQTRVPKTHERSTIIYGHDAKVGLNIQRFSKGLDSGCVHGRKLTALVLSAGRAQVKQDILSVDCPEREKKGKKKKGKKAGKGKKGNKGH